MLGGKSEIVNTCCKYMVLLSLTYWHSCIHTVIHLLEHLCRLRVLIYRRWLGGLLQSDIHESHILWVSLFCLLMCPLKHLLRIYTSTLKWSVWPFLITGDGEIILLERCSLIFDCKNYPKNTWCHSGPVQLIWHVVCVWLVGTPATWYIHDLVMW